MIRSRTTRALRLCATAGLGLLALFAARGGLARAEEAARRLPDATLRASETGHRRVAIFAGGCFWGVQGVFQHLRGVSQAVSGYAGGDGSEARYAAVSSGATGHAEAVQVTYDPAVISYDSLLTIFFSVALDPTQVNRQGPDSGPQYRSALFPKDAEQARVARAYIGQLDAAHLYARPVATTIEPGAAFYPAEAYHQDYMALHPTNPYIATNDAPKLRDLQRFFPERVLARPVLVGTPPA